MIKNIFIIIVCILLLFAGYIAYDMFWPVQSTAKNVEVEIPKGSTFRQAVERLYNQKLIRDKKTFLIIGRITGMDRKIRAGYYSLWTNMSPLDILRILLKGKIIEYEIKVLEGDSIYEIADSFEKVGLMTRKEFLMLAKDKQLLNDYKINAPSIEGYIFPDTYLIAKGMSVRDAVGIMINRMREKYNERLRARANELKMTENEVLTLASIIEKEAVVDEERPLISAVYHNRLRKNMLLQADPTAIYGIKSSKEKITKKDLLYKTPYNTYINRGLPPGPIASPGLKSIEAAINPAKVNYIYFVANDDRTHKFSSTAEGHLKNVRLYRQWKQEIKQNPVKGLNEDDQT